MLDHGKNWKSILFVVLPLILRIFNFVNKQDKYKDKSPEERKNRAKELLPSAQSSVTELEKVCKIDWR